MAPYHLILLLLTAFASLDWVDNLTQRSAYLTQRPPSGTVSSLTLAQEATPTIPETPSSNSDADFPVGLILLGVGGLTITGGAAFILMRLLNKPSEELDEDSEQPYPSLLKETNSTPIIPTNSSSTPASTTLQQPFPSNASEGLPQDSSSNSFVEFPMNPNSTQKIHPNTAEPVDQPKPPQKSTADVAWVEDTPRYKTLDPIEQWILELRGSNPTHRNKAIWELGQQGDSRAIQPLVELLLSSDSKQRSLILASLSEISTRTLKPMNRALSLSLQDENAEVRKNAIRDLSRIYDLIIQMSQLLQRATDDPDAEVQETAHWAINKLARIRPSLPSQENFEDKEMRRQARQARQARRKDGMKGKPGNGDMG